MIDYLLIKEGLGGTSPGSVLGLPRMLLYHGACSLQYIIEVRTEIESYPGAQSHLVET